MAQAHLDILILDTAAHTEVGRCTGPAPDGSCPRVDVGGIVPCAGHDVITAGAHGHPYTAPHDMTLCPVTLAQALALPSDSDLVAA